MFAIISIVILAIFIFFVIRSAKKKIEIQHRHEENILEYRKKHDENVRKHELRDKSHPIFVFVVALKQFNEISSFYDFEKKYYPFIEALQNVIDFRDNKDYEVYSDFIIAEHADMEIPLSKEEIALICNPRSFIVNEFELLDKLFIEYRLQWENRLSEYKNKKSYINRLSYLISETEKLLSKEYILRHSELKGKINILHHYYCELLDSATIK